MDEPVKVRARGRRLRDTDYLYASGRIRALEGRMLGRARMEALIGASSSAEVMERLAGYGFFPGGARPDGADGPAGLDREELLLGVLRDAYREAETSAPDPAVFRFFRYPYDNHNLKTALKCLASGTDPAGLLFDFGTVPAGEVLERVRDGRCGPFPPEMAAAVTRARDAFAKTGDPRCLDAALDRACFADMLRDAGRGGDGTLVRWVRARIDLLNILICLRLARMGFGAGGRAFLEETMPEGGELPRDLLADALEGGETALWAALSRTPYASLAPEDGDVPPLSAVERDADDLFMGIVRADARVPFGAPVPAGYLVGRETEVRNVRIVLAAKDAGLPAGALRERVRRGYV